MLVGRHDKKVRKQKSPGILYRSNLRHEKLVEQKCINTFRGSFEINKRVSFLEYSKMFTLRCAGNYNASLRAL